MNILVYGQHSMEPHDFVQHFTVNIGRRNFSINVWYNPSECKAYSTVTAVAQDNAAITLRFSNRLVRSRSH